MVIFWLDQHGYDDTPLLWWSTTRPLIPAHLSAAVLDHRDMRNSCRYSLEVGQSSLLESEDITSRSHIILNNTLELSLRQTIGNYSPMVQC